jgi:protein TonB
MIDPDSRVVLDNREGRIIKVFAWIAACAVTILIHAGAYWFFTHHSNANPPPLVDQPAAVMIDMSPEVERAFSQTDESLGQPMQESAAEPLSPVDPTPDLMPAVDESPMPPVAPLPPKPPEKPKVKERKHPPNLTKIQQVNKKAAPRSASAPRSDTHDVRTSAASAGAARAREVADWNSQVYAAINREKRRPSGSDATGSPTLRVQVSASGAVTGVAVIATSGSGDLDDAAREAVERASPFPAPPNGARSLTFRMVFH